MQRVFGIVRFLGRLARTFLVLLLLYFLFYVFSRIPEYASRLQ